jgi:twitching motility protein PilT
MKIEDLMRLMVEKAASDLHLRVPSPPVYRIDGVLLPQDEMEKVTPQFMREALEDITLRRKGKGSTLNWSWICRSA